MKMPTHAQSLLAIAVAGACLCAPAAAQTAVAPVKKEEKPAAPPEAASAPSVTVTAERPTNRIDRQVYEVASDINATNGSAAEALANVPSVAVDPDGTVTLRGSTNVQILIDGKPSAMLQGDSRGATLNAMPSEDIESVEVINNPGAQFGNEGGGAPIINLVMRRSRKAGGFGSVSANAGVDGRYNSAASGSYNTGRFGIQGSANVRRDGRNQSGDTRRMRIHPVTGEVTRSSQDAVSEGLNNSSGFNTSLTYNLGEKDTLAASIAYTSRGDDARAEDRYIVFGSDDIVDSDYQRRSVRSGTNDSHTWGGRYEHKGSISGELMRLDLRTSATSSRNGVAYANMYTIRPAGRLDSRSRQDNAGDIRIVDLTGDYERPMEGGFLKLGFKTATNDNEIDTRYTDFDPLSQAAIPNANRSNRFALKETNLALYGSYQMRLNEEWGVLAGLRGEYTDVAVSQFTSNIEAGNHYFNAMPSLFLTWKQSDKSTIRFSYAQRIRRPNAGELNPFVVYRDEFQVSSGNPNLKPVHTDSYEVGYESRIWNLDANLRAFFRRESDLISERKVFISDTVLLTTRDNDGSSQASGLEFSLNGRLLPGLTLNTSGNVAYTERAAVNASAGQDPRRSALSLGGRMNLRYQVSAADQLQMNISAQGKTLSFQGYREPSATMNLSYRRTVTPALNFVVNVTDIFDTNKNETVIDTPLIQDRSFRKADGRVLYIGLSYRIGTGAAGPGPGANRRGPGRS